GPEFRPAALLAAAARGGRCRAAAARRAAAPRHADPVLVIHAAAGLGNVLRAVLHPALGHGAGQGRDAVLDHHLDLAGVDVVILGQAFAQVLGDPLVGARVVLRTTSTMAARALAAAVAVARLAAPAAAPG